MEDLFELKTYLVKINYSKTDLDELGELDEVDLDDILYDIYGIRFDYFEELIEDLLPLCSTGSSPITKKNYKGFANNNIWLLKEEVK